MILKIAFLLAITHYELKTWIFNLGQPVNSNPFGKKDLNLRPQRGESYS